MAKLADRPYHFRGNADGEVSFKSSLTVDSDGVFYATIPDKFGDDKQFAKFAKSIGIPVDPARGKFRIQAKTLDEVDARMRILFDGWLACETTSEYVMCCHAIATCHYALDDFDKIHPNGLAAQEASNVGRDEKDRFGVQSGQGYHWPKTLRHDTSTEPFFSTPGDYCIGLKARIFKKLTHKRGETIQVEYDGRIDADELGEWGRKLQSFVKVSLPEHGTHEIPYTEDAAKFMYLTMMGLCQMADNIVRFFGDDDFVGKFQKMVKAGSLPALTAGRAKDEEERHG